MQFIAAIKAEFSASLLLVFSVTWSSEIILIYWFADKNSCAASYFCENHGIFIFQDYLCE